MFEQLHLTFVSLIPSQEEQQERIKAEKIRIALDKLRAARVKKLVVKVYNDDDPTSKTVAIDQTWTAWEVCKKMMRKNDSEPDPNWVLIERIPQLSIGWCLGMLNLVSSEVAPAEIPRIKKNPFTDKFSRKQISTIFPNFIL